MDFQTPKFREFALLNNHYQISKNEGNQNFKLSKLPKTAWFLQKLALKHNLYWKMKFLKWANYIRHVIADLSKFVQTSMQTSAASYL